MSATCPGCGTAADGGRFRGRCGTHLGGTTAREQGHRPSARADAATLDDGVVSTVAEGELRRLDPATGDVRWTRAADWLDRGGGGMPPSGPSAHVSHLDAGTLAAVVTDEDGSPRTLLIDSDTGEDRAVLEGAPVGSPGAGPGGMGLPLVVASPSPGAELTAFDARGEPQWAGSAELGRYCCATSARLGDRLVLAGHDDPTPYAVLDLADGTVLHEGELGVDGRVHGLLGPATLWVMGGEEPASVAVDAGDGEARWHARRSRLVPDLLEGLVLVVGPGGDLVAADVA